MTTAQRIEEEAHQLPPGELAFKAVGVKKHYPGVKALDGVDLEGYAGSVLGVCGANGAGKSTFAKLLAGVETPTDGEITVTGYPHPVRNAAEAEQAGVLMMHQEPLIIDDFTVGENVWLYKLREGKDIRPWAQKVDTNSAETREVLRRSRAGCSCRTRQLARDLGPGQRQMLSLARAAVDHAQDHDLGRDDRVDQRGALQRHPRPGRPGEEGWHLDHLRLAPAQRGVRDVRPDRGAAQRQAGQGAEGGRHRPGRDHHADDRPGAQGARPAGAGAVTSGQEPVMSVRDLYGGAAKGVSFDVEARGDRRPLRAGRQRPLLGGAHDHRPASGGRRHDQAPRCSRSACPRPAPAVSKGIAYLTEDRRLEGFVKDFDNGENMSLVVLPKMAKAGVVQAGVEKKRVRELIGEYQVKGGTEDLHPHPERRQPAEGRGRQVDGDRPRLRGAGRADQGHRRRCPRQHLRDHPQPSPPAARACWWCPARPRSCFRCATASW